MNSVARESVAAVVVTYNRSRLLTECLAALLRQSRPVDKIILIDNASSDDTAQVLESGGYLANPKIVYRRLSANTGGAGGFHEGMKIAYDMGFDWLWVMDDDAEPFDDALKNLEPCFGRPEIGGVASLTVGSDGAAQTAHRGWLELRNSRMQAHRAIDAAALTPNMEISFASFVGLAVHRSAVKKIGLPMREMFIKADDLEYCLRLATVGPLLLVPNSMILHKEGAAANVELRRRLGLQSQRFPIDKLWLNYFTVRNLLWIKRRHCGDGIASLFAARQYLRLAVGILVFDSNRFKRLRFYWSAIGDAWNDVFDNEKPRRLTRVAPATAHLPHVMKS
jgi:rhamnopyranosyl-N-acetylglucosaminyl-diphospho-decaprenol beta-1,3/1,4-galactofuranosyltransferase